MRRKYGKAYRLRKIQEYTPEYRLLHKRLVEIERSFLWFFRNHSSLNYATGMMQLYGINGLSEKLKSEIEIFLRREI